MSTWYCRLVRSINCSVWACLWMSGTLFTILIEISHYAYFIVLKNCRVLVVIWPTWPVTWDRGYESHWIHKKIEHFFSSIFFSFLVYIYYVHNKYRVFNKKTWKRDHFLRFLTVVFCRFPSHKTKAWNMYHKRNGKWQNSNAISNLYHIITTVQLISKKISTIKT